VVSELQTNNFAERAAELGSRITTTLQQEIGEEKAITEIRGQGLLIAVELECNCTDLVKMALDDGLLINVCSGNTIRLLPPLTMTNEEADLLVDKLAGLIFEFIHNQKNAA
jgi:acetylornithine aminotransferase